MSKLNWWKTACAVCVLFGAAAVVAPAQTFTTLVNFDGNNGRSPYTMSLVQGTDGNLYGTTVAGGANGNGTVFKMTASGKLTTLYAFGSPAGPYAGLVLGTDANFYGTTPAGGIRIRDRL